MRYIRPRRHRPRRWRFVTDRGRCSGGTSRGAVPVVVALNYYYAAIDPTVVW